MNTNHINDYRQLRADIDSLNEAIADKRNQITAYQKKMADIQDNINAINATLEQEERLMSNPSRLRQPTLTVDEFMAKKQQASDLEAQLPALNDALELLNKVVSGLESNLTHIHSSLTAKVDLFAADLVEQSAATLVEAAGDQFKDLVMAVIAKNGMQKEFALDSQNRFRERTSDIVCDILFQAVFGNGNAGYVMPDLSDANRHVVGVIESAI